MDHDPAPDQGPGRERFKTFFTGMRATFPAMKVEAHTMVSEGDKVAFATLTGTHERDFLGISATGNPIDVRACRSAGS